MRQALAALLLLLGVVTVAEAETCFLKQSTALATGIRLGPFVDQTDGFTAETTLTISQADVRLSKVEGAFAQKNDATACTHLENGYYKCPIDATDTNTLGPLLVAVNETGALPVWKECVVLTATNYEALIGTGTAFDANGAIKVQSGTGSNQLDLSSGRLKDDKPAVGRVALKKGSTSYIASVYIESQLTGGPLTGLVFNTASLSAYYTRADQGNADATAISLVAATRGSFTSSGFIQKDATNTPGWYEVGIPNAVLATGSPWATVTLKGAANMKPATIFIELVDNVAGDLATLIGTPTTDVSTDIAVTGKSPVGSYRKNVAAQRAHPIFFRSTSSVQSGLTGLGTGFTVTVSKDGGAFGATTGTNAEIANGAYLFSPSAADVNCDTCYFQATGAGAVSYFFYIFTAP